MAAPKTPGSKTPSPKSAGLNTPSDIVADLQVGPTDLGMVRIFITADGVDLPMDFTPEEAMDIATELMAAAEVAGQAGEPKD